MDKDNKQWEKLVSMPEEYAQDPNLADRAIAEINDRKPQVKKPWLQVHWKKLTACAVSLALVVGIGLPIYSKFNKPLDTTSSPEPPPVVYYDNNDLAPLDVTDVAKYLSDNALRIGFFDVPTAKSKIGTIKETGKIALVYQKLVYVGNAGFDQIELNVVLEKNLTLDFYQEYVALSENITVNEVTVQYDTATTKNGLQQVFAKFTHESADYYLNVVTLSEPTECINTYVTMLVG